ncbi:MAG: hypothetical protein R3D05_11445 [Dongiaceae bacterium]
MHVPIETAEAACRRAGLAPTAPSPIGGGSTIGAASHHIEASVADRRVSLCRLPEMAMVWSYEGGAKTGLVESAAIRDRPL